MKTRKKIAFKIFQWLITAMVALIILIPIYWIFISSIKPNEDLFTIPIEWIPKHFTLKSYKTLIEQRYENFIYRIRVRLQATFCRISF